MKNGSSWWGLTNRKAILFFDKIVVFVFEEMKHEKKTERKTKLSSQNNKHKFNGFFFVSSPKYISKLVEKSAINPSKPVIGFGICYDCSYKFYVLQPN